MKKIDWLDEQPYIGKYFLLKIKRFLMGIIFNIWRKIDTHLLEKYFAEVKFNNKEEGDKYFEAYMPFIILSRNHKEAEDVISQINDELKSRYNFKVTRLYVQEEPISDIRIEQEKEKIVNGSKGKVIGKMNFSSYVGKKKESPFQPYLPESYTKDLKTGTFQINESQIDFQIIKDTKNHLYQNETYTVILNFSE